MDYDTIIRRSLVLASFVAIVIVYCPFVEYTLIVVFFMALYVRLNRYIETTYPGTIELDGEYVPKFRLYVSLIHDAIAGVIMLIIVLLHYFIGSNGVLYWLECSWNDSFTNNTNENIDTLLDALDLIAMCGTMAFEMKDSIVDDFSWNLERMGIYIHHVATVGACLYILNCNYGRGYMILNGLQCLVGSSIYCIWRLSKLSTVVYCISMTLSNMFGIWLLIQYYILAQDHGDIPITFVTLCSFICFVRQYPVMEVIVHQLRQHQSQNKGRKIQ